VGEDLVERYRREAAEALELEAMRRIAENSDPEEDARLRNISLSEIKDIVPSLLARLGQVRAALDGHGGGITVASKTVTDEVMDIVLDLTGACLSCGAAPGTLESIKEDLENDVEISRIRFSANLLDTFDEIGREFILAHGQVDFV
jgi:Fe-S cluster biogenesis protein NfuA